jgi:hypothetical protein
MTSRRGTIALCSFVFAFDAALPAVALAQCPSCELTLRKITEIREAEDGGPLGNVTAFERLRDGRVLLAHSFAPNAIQVYSASGRWLSTIGRKGDGPGEFGRIARILSGPGDSIHVLDGTHRRRSVFNAGLQFVRSTPLPVPPLDGKVLANGHLVINGVHRTREAAGMPLHEFDDKGNWIRSFSDGEPIMRPDLLHLLQRRMALLPSGRLITARVDRLAIQVWNADRTSHRDVPVKGTWYPTLERAPVWDLSEPPPTIVTALLALSDTTALLLAAVPRANYQRGFERQKNEYGKPVMVLVNFQEVYSTRVELIDLRTGRTRLSTALSTGIGRALDNEHVLSSSTTIDGGKAITVWQLKAISR